MNKEQRIAELEAHVEALRAALVELRGEVSAGCHPDAPVEELKDGIHYEVVLQTDALLASTPTQSLAKVKAETLRDLVDETNVFDAEQRAWLYAEADRIEKGGAE